MMKLLSLLALSSLASVSAYGTAGSTSAQNFNRFGFPIVSLLFALLIFVAVGYRVGFLRWLDTRGATGFLVGIVIQFLFGIFFIFGFDEGAMGNRSTVIGVYLLCQSVFGWYSVIENSKRSRQTFLGVAIFVFLSLCGTNSLFAFTTPAWEVYGDAVSGSGCSSYFGFTGTNNERCDDVGFIGLLRVIGAVSVFIQFYLMFYSFHGLNEDAGDDSARAPLLGAKSSSAGGAAAASEGNAATAEAGGYQPYQ